MIGRMSEERARAWLAHEFPAVPEHIVAAVFAAYRRITPSVRAAAQAAHDRLHDARAT